MNLLRQKGLLMTLAAFMSLSLSAQRFTDNLDRGLVAVNMDNTVFLSWRVLAEENDGVTYNVYRDGTLVADNLKVSNYSDSGVGSTYAVAAVVKGVEQPQCTAVKTWGNGSGAGLLNIKLADVYDRTGKNVTSHYEPNDAEFADLDGDGQLEMIIKRLNWVDAGTSDGSTDGEGNLINNKGIYEETSKEFVVLDAYDINWQTGAATLMWRIDCGPNMVSLNSTEINIIAYDWDEDGVAEVVLRGADNMIAYGSSGRNQLYTIGDMSVNTRNTFGHTDAQYAWTHSGSEFLIYLNGTTGIPYQVMDFPLKRLEYHTTLSEEWGGRGYGHNSSKYFFGAPFLDGRKASLFLGRGIYGSHKMIAMNLDRKSHEWSEHWRWNCMDSSSKWYGNGYHNFVIADVDEDGRDEIVYGSMVIDDNGKGLHTTGLGHGDAQHVSDLDPWRRGLEFFGCLEGSTGFDYRNATTGQIYYRAYSDGDDGRCIAGNFLNNYPGSIGRSAKNGIISCVTDQSLPEISDVIAWSDCNFRIYWDGDLCSEILNSPGTAREAKIEKPGVGRIFDSVGCNMNNDSKNNACFQGDLLGDWREEIVLRCGTNVRVYTSTNSSHYAMPSLWFDHQYRQAMVWQMMAYNQPPHLSYFMGEAEDYTVAPPPLTMRGRTELQANSSFGTEYDGQDLLFCPQENASLTFSGKVAPASLTINTPTWVEGHDNNNNITTTTYTHTLTYDGGGSTLQGDMRLVKQGNGTLNMPKKTLTYTGHTDIWGGTVNFQGTLTDSKVWMNRFTTLNLTGATLNGGLEMNYDATLHVGGPTAQTLSTVTITDLKLNYGARVVIDLNSTDLTQNDQLNLTTLTIGSKDWENGPTYGAPVFQFNCRSSLADGRYPIGTLTSYEGNLDRIYIEGVTTQKAGSSVFLYNTDGMLYLVVGGQKPLSVPGIEFASLSECTLGSEYPTSEGQRYFLPVVSITKNPCLYGGREYYPNLHATFTDLKGQTTELGSDEAILLYKEDYENATEITGWTTPGANISLGTGDATHGNYFQVITGETNTRWAYYRFNVDGVVGAPVYHIDFDLALTPANQEPIEFCVMSKGGKNPPSTWNNYATTNDNANMLFDLTGSANSTSYTVNGTTTNTTLNAGTWYHVSLMIDQDSRTVKWTLSNGDYGTFNLPDGTSTEFDGFYIVAARYYSAFKLDNISITTPASFSSSYTFTQPGTLTVTASLDGFISSESSYTVSVPYQLLCETAAYNEVAAADAASVLGGSFSTEPYHLRWAYWSQNNPKYGESYVMVSSDKNGGYIDDAAVLDFQTNKELCLVQDFGIGCNDVSRNYNIVARNLIDENTFIYYKADKSRGGATNYDEGYTYANADGTWTYEMFQNTTFCKFAAYRLYEPYLIGDANGNGVVNVSDVMQVVNYILGEDPVPFIFKQADVNGDKLITVSDVMAIVNIILGL